MAPGSTAMTASSATPTPLGIFRHKRSSSSRNEDGGDATTPREGPNITSLAPPLTLVRDGRSMSNASMFGPRTASLANSANPPGSFSSNLELTGARSARPELQYDGPNDFRSDDTSSSERRQTEYRDQINKELKIKVGSENLLEALHQKPGKQQKDQLLRVENELQTSNRKIFELQSALANEIERSHRPPTPLKGRISAIFQGSPLRSSGSRQSPTLISGTENGDIDDDMTETESPTFVLAEILQSLEVEGMQPDYYVRRANTLVDLFKRHPTLKYDLAWSIFGLRVQMMLLSESREVVAAGYRVTRHAIGDRKSLQTIRKMNTDFLVCLSLAKDSKATIEREQALKFVRAFVDVKDGVSELSNAVIRAVVSVAEHSEDRLRNISLLTLTEILVRNPELLVRAGGVNILTEALRDGTYNGSESIVAAFLYLVDVPQQRRLLLLGGLELQGPFNIFSDNQAGSTNEERLKTCARSISAIINSWPGLFTLSQTGFNDITSLMMSLNHPAPFIRNLLLDLLFDLLHIKPPSWTSSFLAGRRLTTYGRVANLRADFMEDQSRLENEDDLNRVNLVDHYRCLVLAILVECGLVKVLSQLILNNEDQALQRKATLLLNEVLKIADQSLSAEMSGKIQILKSMMKTASDGSVTLTQEDLASDMVYQIDSVNKTLMRSRTRAQSTSKVDGIRTGTPSTEAAKPKLSIDMDEIQFRSLMGETQVPASSNYTKWKWDVILDIIEGPLQNPKRFEDAKSTKFLKRLIAFYRPFKYSFTDIRNTKPNQRYVRIGCALMKCLVKTPEGVAYLSESKLMAQLAECLAQFDWMSGITSDNPLFSPQYLTETICAGYFSMLGAITSEPQGLEMLNRWKMINMIYHILDLKDRVDIIQLLLGNMDFTLDSHLRVMLSKALTSSPKGTRIFATKLLRKYATKEPSDTDTKDTVSFWAIRLLVTQLYDPVIEVSEVAVEILQEACNRKQYLEYVVRCRPALDHLGEIAAPLLLRFLSTSLGYQYLDGLDYITQEMDDWFLGRNEKYVTLVEASLNRAFSFEPEKSHKTMDENMERHQFGVVPPHFYRELTRTAEGCKLLEQSGHFEEFVSNIKDFWQEDEDTETMLKVKGSLWAIGNVGSMELGAPFLEDSNVVDWIIKTAEQSSVITMRGTAFFVLGLISRSLHGSEILTGLGWNSPVNALGQSLGFVLPTDLFALFRVCPLPPPSHDDEANHIYILAQDVNSTT